MRRICPSLIIVMRGGSYFHWLEIGVLETQCRWGLRSIDVLFGKWCVCIAYSGKKASLPNEVLKEEVCTAQDK